jgi:hypothetical protein
VTEDAESSLRILKRGYRSLYVNRAYGRGLMPFDFSNVIRAFASSPIYQYPNGRAPSSPAHIVGSCERGPPYNYCAGVPVAESSRRLDASQADLLRSADRVVSVEA